MRRALWPVLALALIGTLPSTVAADDMFRFDRYCRWLASAESEMHRVDGLEIRPVPLDERIAHLDQRLQAVEKARGLDVGSLDATLGLGDRKASSVHVNVLLPGLLAAVTAVGQRLDRIYRAPHAELGEATGRDPDVPPFAGALRFQLATVTTGNWVGLRSGPLMLSVELLGVHAPLPGASHAAGEPHGSASRRFLRTLLTSEEVFLVRDATVPVERKSLFVTAFLYRARDGPFVNEAMIREGRARAVSGTPHRHRRRFLAVEAKAREASRGLWKEPDASGAGD